MCKLDKLWLSKWVHRADDGSGTILGVGLIIIVCSMLILSANIGYILIEKHRVHAVSSSAVLSGVKVLQKLEGDACDVVKNIVNANNVTIESCKSENDDVTITVSVQTKIPFIPKIVDTVKAGLVSCDD